jgi:prophage antirepressor-like protein
MTALTTIGRDFNGLPLTFIEKGEALWLTGEELGRALGYAEGTESRKVRALADAHRDEVAKFRSTVRLAKGGPGSGRPGGAQEVAIFAEPALYLLACHAETERAAEFRAWLAETLHDLRTRDKVLVDRDEWDKQRDLSITLLQAYEQQSEAMRKVASAAGHILSLRRRTKPKDDPRQLVFDGVTFEEIDGPESTAGASS